MMISAPSSLSTYDCRVRYLRILVQIKKPPEPGSLSYQGEEAAVFPAHEMSGQSWDKRRHRLPGNLCLTNH